MRNLENENQRLSVQIRTNEEVVKTERTKMRAAFEVWPLWAWEHEMMTMMTMVMQTELSDARRLLDETSKEKARLQIEADKARAEFDNLRGRIGKLEKELKESENRRMYNESQVQDLQAKLNTADAQRKHWEDEAKVQPPSLPPLFSLPSHSPFSHSRLACVRLRALGLQVGRDSLTGSCGGLGLAGALPKNTQGGGGKATGRREWEVLGAHSCPFSRLLVECG